LRRIIRIWPIYFGCVLVAYFLFHFPFADFVRYLFFLEYWKSPLGLFPLFVFWTLQLEEWMYLVIPLIHRASQSQKLRIGIAMTAVWVVYAANWFNVQGALGNLLGSDRPDILAPEYLAFYAFDIFAYLGYFSNKNLRLLAPIGMVVYGYAGFYHELNPALHLPFLIGFAAVLVNPPKFLHYFLLLGEESYALYAIHTIFLLRFGLVGILYVLRGSLRDRVFSAPKADS
jgi:peptidoglycan/LPS O-acetylase OafA/YrhL